MIHLRTLIIVLGLIVSSFSSNVTDSTNHNSSELVILQNDQMIYFNDYTEVVMNLILPKWTPVTKRIYLNSTFVLQVQNEFDNVFDVEFISNETVLFTNYSSKDKWIYEESKVATIQIVRIISRGNSSVNATLIGRFLVHQKQHNIMIDIIGELEIILFLCLISCGMLFIIFVSA